MTLHHAIWTVGATPQPLAKAVLPSEQALEDMIVAAPQILSDSWMLVGRQEKTIHGGRIDLLAVAPDGALILIEVKRDRTPRDVVAQALDYASWVETLKPEDIDAIYGRFAPGRSLAADFRARFGADLDEEQLNQTHEVVIVAAELDADSQRIVAYLADRGIAINVLCFQIFAQGPQQFISRAWLVERGPESSTDPKPAPGLPAEPWNGEFYASFGAGPARSWDKAVKYGFISAGGASCGVDPLPWTPRGLRRRCPRCRNSGCPTRRSSGGRWWSWSDQGEHRRSFLASSSQRHSRSGTGSA